MSVDLVANSGTDSSSPDPHARPPDAASAEERIVVLVHGTKLPQFKRSNGQTEVWPWTDARSDFRVGLAANLKGTIVDDEFTWTGGNSHDARLHAGDELAAHLEKRHAEHPAARLMILAHSHGGTVSLYAMQKLSGVDYVSDLIFMNTPFLECQKRYLEKFVLVILPSWMGVFVGVGILTMNSPRSDFYEMALMMTFFLAMPVFVVAKKRLPLLQEFLYQRIKLRPPSARLVNITCDDEVGFWLGIAHYLANIPFRVWFFVTRWGFRFFATCFALSMLGFLVTIPIMISHHNSLDTKSFAGALVGVLWLAAGYIGAGIPIFAGITGVFAMLFLSVLFLVPRTIHGNRFAFGDDLAQNILLDISAHNEPSIQDRQDYSSWKYNGASLGQRHFAYRYPLAIDYVRETLANPGPWLKQRNVDSGTPSLGPPAKLTWRSVLADFKPEESEKAKLFEQFPGKRLGVRIFIGALGVFFTLAIVSEINGCVSSRKQTQVLKSVGFPPNATYQSDVTLPSATLTQMANVLSGYQSHLESVGHPTTWTSVRVVVARSLDPPEPGKAPSRSEWYLSANSRVLTLNGSSLPDRKELVEGYGEVLFSIPESLSDSSDQTGQAITEGFIQYFCSSYVDSPCMPMVPHLTWPQGAYSGGYALAQALFDIEVEAGSDLTDRAVMRAFLATQSQQHPDIRSFANTVAQQLGNQAESARTHFAAHGIAVP